MKKLVSIIFMSMLPSNIVIAQQDFTIKQSGKSENNPVLQSDKKDKDSILNSILTKNQPILRTTNVKEINAVIEEKKRTV